MYLYGSGPVRRAAAVVIAAALTLNLVSPALAAAQQGRPAPQRPAGPQRPAAGDTIPARTPGDTVPARRESRPDSLYDALLRLRGYTPVEYRGDSAQFSGAQRVLRLRGDAQVSRAGTQLTAADSIVYRERNRFVEAYGTPKVTGQGQDITGNVMFHDLNTGRTSVRGARTSITDQATWLVQGDVTSEKQTRIYATNSTFTSDDREDPAYHFRAERIKVIRDRILVGRPAVLYFRNVPVMALPFIVQDLEKGRRSGLLIPRFEINDIIRTNSARGNTRGTGRQISNIGYYWAINEYLGAELSGGWRSGTYRSLAGSMNFNWRRQFLQGGTTFEHFWTEDEGRRLNLNSSAGWKPDERTDLALQLNYAESSAFERNRSVDPLRATQDLSSTFSMNRRFDWGTLSSAGERRQSLANGDVRMTLPSFGLNVNPITLFPSADPTDAGVFNDMVLTFGVNGSRQVDDPSDAFHTRRPGSEVTSLSSSPTLRIGNLSLNTGFNFNRTSRDGLAAISSADAVEGVGRGLLGSLPASDVGRISWNAGTSYQVNLIGSTYLAPSISISRDWVRQENPISDILVPGEAYREAFGRYVASPMRVSFGTGLNADLYGFFPGVGSYSAIRHHLKPNFNYRFSPEVQQTPVQEAAFGRSNSRPISEFIIGLDQTFEAKRREPARQPADTVARDTVADGRGGATSPPAAPANESKVTMLSISTSALAFSFVPADTTSSDVTGRRFRTDDLQNTIRTDYFGGLNFTVGHDLFREDIVGNNTVVGRQFSPYLTSVSTSFQLGQNSSLLRFLGLARTPAESRAVRDTVPLDTVGQATRAPTVQRGGSQTFTANPQQAGAGAWNLSLRYSLARPRPPLADSLRRSFDRGNQDLSGTLTFYPTKNWGVNWTTSYSITEGRFHQHSLNLTRDLYRWNANIDFYRTATGNTSFSFRVSLTDLPDLKFDHRETNLGIDRPQTRPGEDLNR